MSFKRCNYNSCWNASCAPKACASKILVHEQLVDALVDTYQDILINWHQRNAAFYWYNKSVSRSKNPVACMLHVVLFI